MTDPGTPRDSQGLGNGMQWIAMASWLRPSVSFRCPAVARPSLLDLPAPNHGKSNVSWIHGKDLFRIDEFQGWESSCDHSKVSGFQFQGTLA